MATMKNVYVGDLPKGRRFRDEDGTWWKVVKNLSPSCVTIRREVKKVVEVKGRKFVATRGETKTWSCGVMVQVPTRLKVKCFPTNNSHTCRKCGTISLLCHTGVSDEPHTHKCSACGAVWKHRPEDVPNGA